MARKAYLVGGSMNGRVLTVGEKAISMTVPFGTGHDVYRPTGEMTPSGECEIWERSDQPSVSAIAWRDIDARR